MLLNEVELETAQQILINSIERIQSEVIPLEKALGNVLAEDIFAPINVPGFRKSPLDGFALNSSDTKGATSQIPSVIKIIDEVQAGDTREIDILPAGYGIKIATGAPLPSGADVVIKKEDVVYKNNKIFITKELIKNNNVVSVGSDMKKGELILSEGELLTPYHIGVIAALGLPAVKVYKSPRIAVLSTGNELKYPGEPLMFGQIYNSNLYSLIALINSLGGHAYPLGNMQDNVKEIEKKILESLDQYDLILTTGGASVGDYDLLEKTLIKIGANVLFNRVSIKPGSPVIAGIKNNKLIIGLSGNPAAALISFELLVSPVIKKLKGHQDVTLKCLNVELVDGFFKKSPQRRFLRVHVSYENGKWVAKQTGNQQSSILRSMVGCNALIDIPRGSDIIPPGSTVKAIFLKKI
ncbi:MAG: molybdopterin molybdotransferase [Clostridia bacterium]|nr:molybdopterin molybdotransferase [Clostridia bacterium]